MKSTKITKTNHAGPYNTPEEASLVHGKFFNDLMDDFAAHVPSDGEGKLDTLDEYTAGAGVKISNLEIHSDGSMNHANGVSFHVPYISSSIPNLISTVAGAVQTSVFTNSYYTGITSGAGGVNTIALQDPWIDGQLRKIELVVDAADLTVTIASNYNCDSATFGDAGDYIILMAVSGVWNLIENHGCTIVSN